MDFVSDALFDDRRLRALTIVDAFKREALMRAEAGALLSTLIHSVTIYPDEPSDPEAEVEVAQVWDLAGVVVCAPDAQQARLYETGLLWYRWLRGQDLNL